MVRKTLVLGVVGVLLAACGSSGSSDAQSGSVQGVTDDEILISGFGPLTGPASWIGLGNRDSFALAVKEINDAGGIHGRKIKFEFADDEYEVAKAQGVVRKILDQDKPFLVYTGTGSTVFLSLADQFRATKLPVYNGFSGSEEARKTPEVANLYHGEAVSTKWVTPYTVDMIVDKLGTEEIAVMHEDGEWGKTLCASIVEEMKARDIEPLTNEEYTSTATDFTAQLLAVKNAKPDVVVNCGLMGAAKIILRQASELNVNAIFVGDAAQANQTVWEDAGGAAENWLFSWYQPQFLTDETGAMGEFRDKFFAEYPDAPEGRPNHADTFAYGAAYLIAHALERAGSDLTAEKFLAEMKKAKEQPTPISGPADCTNDRNECFVDLSWMIVKGGDAQPATDEDFAEIAGTLR